MNLKEIIEEVRKRPVLYDWTKYGRVHGDRVARWSAWREISANLGNCGVAECKRKWIYLRQSLALNLRKQADAGAKPWKYENDMKFLIPFIRKRKRRKSKFKVEIKQEEVVTLDSDEESRFASSSSDSTAESSGRLFIDSDNNDNNDSNDNNPPVHDNRQPSSTFVLSDVATQNNGNSFAESNYSPPLLSHDNSPLSLSLRDNNRPTSQDIFHSLCSTPKSLGPATHNGYSSNESDNNLHDSNPPLCVDNRPTSLVVPHSHYDTSSSLELLEYSNGHSSVDGDNSPVPHERDPPIRDNLSTRDETPSIHGNDLLTNDNNLSVNDNNTQGTLETIEQPEALTPSAQIQDHLDLTSAEKEGEEMTTDQKMEEDMTSDEKTLKNFLDILFSTVCGFSTSLQLEFKGKLSALVNDFEIRNYHEAKGELPSSAMVHGISCPAVPNQINPPFIPSHVDLSSLHSQMNPSFVPSQMNPPFMYCQENSLPIQSQMNSPSVLSQMYYLPSVYSQTNPSSIPSQMNFPSVYSQTNPSSMPSQMNLPSTCRQMNPPSIPSQMNLPFMCRQMNPPSIPSQINLAPSQSQMNPTSAHSQTNISSKPSQMNIPIAPNQMSPPFVTSPMTKFKTYKDVFKSQFAPSHINPPLIPSQWSGPPPQSQINPPSSQMNLPSIQNQTNFPSAFTIPNKPAALDTRKHPTTESVNQSQQSNSTGQPISTGMPPNVFPGHVVVYV